MKTSNALFKNEFRLSLRDMNMPIFALAMPVVVMALLGMIYGTRPAFEGAPYSFVAQSFGAVASIALCAGGTMGLPLVIAEYRHRKILKRFQVTPVTPALLLWVQVAVYAVYGLLSLVLVYATAALFGFGMQGSWLRFAGGYALVMVSLFSLGVMVGGLAPNPKIAGILASLLYFPMLIFSGATVPFEVLPAALQRVAQALPLTQGIALLKAATLNLPTENLALPIGVMAGMALVCTAAALRWFRWE